MYFSVDESTSWYTVGYTCWGGGGRGGGVPPCIPCRCCACGAYGGAGGKGVVDGEMDGGDDDDDADDEPSFLLLLDRLRFMIKTTATADPQSRARPPSTPPMMAPTLVLLPLAGDGDGLAGVSPELTAAGVGEVSGVVVELSVGDGADFCAVDVLDEDDEDVVLVEVVGVDVEMIDVDVVGVKVGLIM